MRRTPSYVRLLCGNTQSRNVHMSIVSNLPACTGVGFKPAHFRDIFAAPQPLGFFEVHAENYMGAGGPPHAQLGALRERYALSVHGVGLSIGSMEPLNRDHLIPLKMLVRRLATGNFSGHLALSAPNRCQL